VTVVEFTDRLCPAMDMELISAFQRSLKKNLGFSFKFSTKVTAADIRKVCCVCECVFVCERESV